MPANLRNNAARKSAAAAAAGGSSTRKTSKKAKGPKAAPKENENEYTSQVSLSQLCDIVKDLAVTVKELKAATNPPPPPAEHVDTQQQHESESEEESGTEDIPPPVEIRALPEIQKNVKKRLESAGMTTGAPDPQIKKKGKGSGRNRTQQDEVVKYVPWPHFFVTTTSSEPVQYDNLTQSQFMEGFLQIVLDQQDQATQLLLLKYLQNLAIDISKHGFDTVRDFHALVLGRIEQNRLTWSDNDQMILLKQQHVWNKPVVNPARDPAPAAKPHTARPWTPCIPYQDGKCSQKGDHFTPKGYVKHVCAFCKTRNKVYSHPESECLKKQNAKNSN